MHTILKSRSINTAEIKDKEERKYWEKMKKANAIPTDYISTDEILLDLSKFTKEKRL